MIDVSSYNIDKTIGLLAVDSNAFEEQYIRVRKNEQRIYTNEEVALLPDISPNHIHYAEWKIRKRSCNRLINYLRKKNRPLNILEAGCGNGWLSSKMAEIDNTLVTGLDINITELKQACEIFNHKANLVFIYGDVHDKLTSGSFDTIVFAASIQYFPSIKEILDTAFSLLNTGGEIHILDTFFYKKNEVKNAIERTKNYYTALGHNDMADYYFHHTVDELKAFDYQILSPKNSIINKLSGKTTPFPWIRITGNK
ncbi:MAG: class SAM-dependent methyltransferase [Chitinophagaceae bacterium]|nr:class SAM-dependent methyltransferase [Chitinophagaceae bacterium]